VSKAHRKRHPFGWLDRTTVVVPHGAALNTVRLRAEGTIRKHRTEGTIMLNSLIQLILRDGIRRYLASFTGCVGLMGLALIALAIGGDHYWG
jgi:hypothetical protein